MLYFGYVFLGQHVMWLPRSVTLPSRWSWASQKLSERAPKRPLLDTAREGEDYSV